MNFESITIMTCTNNLSSLWMNSQHQETFLSWQVQKGVMGAAAVLSGEMYRVLQRFSWNLETLDTKAGLESYVTMKESSDWSRETFRGWLCSLLCLPAARSNCPRLRWDALILPKGWVVCVADSIYTALGMEECKASSFCSVFGNKSHKSESCSLWEQALLPIRLKLGRSQSRITDLAAISAKCWA